MKWKKVYNDFVNFYNEHNRYPKRNSEDKIEKYLGYWVYNQKSQYKNKVLSQERINALKSLDFWVWDKQSLSWEQNYKELVDFINKHNRYPLLSDNPKLINWVKNNRRKYKKNKLSEERIKKLEEITSWVWDKYPSEWNKNYNNLIFFHNEHKKEPSQVGNTDHEVFLSRWVFTQRASYRKNTIKKEYKDKLESLDWWEWKKDNNKIWEDYYNNFINFNIKHGRKPNINNKTEKILAKWYYNQIIRFKKGKLKKERLQKLQVFDFWNEVDNSWLKNYSELPTHAFIDGLGF